MFAVRNMVTKFLEEGRHVAEWEVEMIDKLYHPSSQRKWRLKAMEKRTSDTLFSSSYSLFMSILFHWPLSMARIPGSVI